MSIHKTLYTKNSLFHLKKNHKVCMGGGTGTTGLYLQSHQSWLSVSSCLPVFRAKMTSMLPYTEPRLKHGVWE